MAQMRRRRQRCRIPWHPSCEISLVLSALLSEVAESNLVTQETARLERPASMDNGPGGIRDQG